MSSYYKGKDTARNFLRTRFIATKSCREAKKNRDELEAIVSDLSKKAIGSSYWKGEYDVYKQRLQDVRAYYNFGDCDNYFIPLVFSCAKYLILPIAFNKLFLSDVNECNVLFGITA